jgi:DNA-binding NarL/FixJ family response regulator
MSRANLATNIIEFPEHLLGTAQPLRLRAVVVDDSPSYREIVCTLVEMDDVVDVVGRASNGADAIRIIAHLRPDLAIMDVEMPLVDGPAAASFISQQFPRTAIILMSAENSPRHRAASLDSGAKAFIYKPNFREEFLRALDNVFDICSFPTLPAS